jgi:hypothetical protein
MPSRQQYGSRRLDVAQTSSYHRAIQHRLQWIACGVAMAVVSSVMVFLILARRDPEPTPAHGSQLRRPIRDITEMPIVRRAGKGTLLASSQRSPAPANSSPRASSHPVLGGVEVSGVVNDGTGGVIIGAQVTARSEVSDQVRAVVQSDVYGRFVLFVPAGPVQLEANAEAYSHASLTIHAPARNVVLTVIPESTISGLVITGDTAAPIAGAQVTATNENGQRIPARRVRAKADGTFVFDGLPAGMYDLVAQAAEWRSEPVATAIAVGEELSGVVLTARAAASLTATVTVGDEPCAQGLVDLVGPVTVQERILDGAVRFTGLLAGPYEVTLRCSRLGAGSQVEASSPVAGEDVLKLGLAPVSRAWTLRPQDGLAPDEPTATIRVSVEGSDEFRALRVEVRRRDGPFVSGVQKKGDGYVFEGLALGDYEVAIPLQETMHEVSLKTAGQVADVQLPRPKPMGISGRVTDTRGVAVPDAWVHAAWSGESTTIGTPILTDADGLFAISNLPAGRYDVIADAAFGGGRTRNVEGGATGVDLCVAALASLSGTVVDGLGAPVERFTISYRRSGESGLEAVAGFNGSWALNRLPPGAYGFVVVSSRGRAHVQATMEPGAHAVVDVVVDPGNESDPSDLF